MFGAMPGIMRYARKFQACLLPYRNIAGLAPNIITQAELIGLYE
jgi:hypothetical protein